MSPKGFDPENAECPKCGGEMWDNRDDKRSAKSPDFKCKDKDNCDGAVWIDPPKGNRNGAGRGGRGANSNGGGRVQGAPEPAPAKVPLTAGERKLGREKVMTSYFGLMKLAQERMSKIAKDAGVALTMDDVHAATYSLYKILDQKKYLEPPPTITEAGRPAERTPAPAARPQPAPPREMAAAGARNFEEYPAALDDDDSHDLPF